MQSDPIIIVDSDDNSRRAQLLRAQNPTQTSSSIEVEIESLLNMPFLHENSCPIEYWKSKPGQLSKIFMKYCAIPASQVESERLFSVAGEVFDDRRKALDPQRASKQIIVKQALRE